MDIYTIDFETYYAKDYTLSKLTTEEYVRDPRFEAIIVGVKKNSDPAYWVDQHLIADHLHSLELHNHAVIAHHAHFDGLILSHHYGIRPKVWFDTLSMARAIHSHELRSLSLKALAEHYNVGAKGEEVLLARGKHRADFTPQEIHEYGNYCVNDCQLETFLFHAMLPRFPKSELKLIDLTIRLFTEPLMHIAAPVLEEYVKDIRVEKSTLLLQAGIQLTDVMSNEKFADALRRLGVEPPMKVSPTTGKLTYAFAKTDTAMEELAEHPDDAVQTLIAARLKNKTTINETRAVRMIGMSQRGPACVYLKYYGASGTGRMSGGDKMNWQNFGRGGKLRQAVIAPPGHLLVVGDSSTIEARVLDYIACQEDAVEVYRKADRKEGPDAYCTLAEAIYNYKVTKADNPDERQMGKIAKLGLGYGMGAPKFQSAVRVQTKGEVIIEDAMAARVVTVYREKHPHVMALHKRAGQALALISKGKEGVAIDPRGIVRTCKEGILLPNGMKIYYPDLKFVADGSKYGGGEWTFWNGKKREHIYGGKVVENIVQALARIIVMDQTLLVAERVPVVMSVHDEVVGCVAERYAVKAERFVLSRLRVPPAWALDLPLNSEGGCAVSYGEAK